ncbi:hypothetical protein CBM2631_A100306 [Cupriavidus taiwanensis]|nr:hypothetical protein CBM2631_A100306 [Cupriavidus taiwanensis]
MTLNHHWNEQGWLNCLAETPHQPPGQHGANGAGTCRPSDRRSRCTRNAFAWPGCMTR